jgi:AAA domain
MQMSQLKPASQLARRYGVKATIFGGPGSGKTPLMNTAPRPVLLVTEPGMLSMRGSSIPAWEAYTPALVAEFFEWFMKSREASNFDTLGIDSISNIAELILADELAKVKHGMKAYGNMSERVMKICNDLYYMPQKHIAMIAKQALVENGRQTILQNGEVTYEPIMQKRPFFPGKDLNVKVPHLFDNVMHLGEVVMPGQPKPVRALRTKEIPEVFARDRLGNLNEVEQPDLSLLFAKAMQ